MSTDEILKEALVLTPPEKARMIEALITSLDKPDPEMDDLWGKEAEARLNAIEAGKTKAVPFEKVFPSK